MNDGLKDKHRRAIIDALAANPRVGRVVLFGSRATGTFTPTSDVDLVLLGDELTLTDQARLAAAVEALSIPQRVDLIRYKAIESKKLLAEIRDHGVAWFDRDAARKTPESGTDPNRARQEAAEPRQPRPLPSGRGSDKRPSA